MEFKPGGGKPIQRLPLARSRKRLKFERRLHLYLWLLFLPALLLAILLLQSQNVSIPIQITMLVVFAMAWLLAVSVILEQIVRPLQTLANVVAALREDDYSFRARGGQREDALGDLALEINLLANILQSQRVSAVEAVALLERVVESMETPVLTLDPDNRLRLINPAGTRLLGLAGSQAVGRTAEELNLGEILAAKDQSIISLYPSSGQAQTAPAQWPARWMVRRTTFRQHGVPQTLLLLSDVSSALREEERQAWQRLIRVLGHEINNSLAPIKSIAGSLRARVPRNVTDGDDFSDFERGLLVIENRAESLNRFVQAYRNVAQLPAPAVRAVSLHSLVERAISLETRLQIELLPSSDVAVSVDPDQVEQLLINLLKNAVEAATEASESAITNGEPTRAPIVHVGWTIEQSMVGITIQDNGPGLTNSSNLFVPFYTTKKSGTGVGLILARQIAEANRGTLSLANREDESGCEAIVRLPLARVQTSSPIASERSLSSD